RMITFKGDLPASAEVGIRGAEKIKAIDGVWDVVVHGGEDGRFWRQFLVYGPDGSILTKNGKAVVRWVEVTPEEIKQGLLDAGWKPGQPVRLISCQSGSSGAADALANELGKGKVPPTWVRAPETTMSIEDGRIQFTEDVKNADGSVTKKVVSPRWK